MRETFTSLQSQAHSFIGTAVTDATSNAILKKNINQTIRFVQAKLGDYQVTKELQFTSTAGQLYYHNPPGFVQIESVVVTIGSVQYPLTPIDSQLDWDYKNAVTFTGTAFPRFFFQRQNDYGIWPTLQSAYTVTLKYKYRSPDLTTEDYTTGTATFTNNSVTVTGSGTTWTVGMIGRYIQAPDGNWYKISAFNSTTSIDLESYYEGTTTSGSTYTIGESPELPEEAHELIPYRAAAMYLGGVRGDTSRAQGYDNFFWTGDFQLQTRKQTAEGGLIDVINRYASRSNSAVVRPIKRRADSIFNDKLFATTIS